jgi:hypothetical protein
VAARLRELGLPLAEEALDAATGYTLDILISDAAGIAAPSGEFALAHELAAARANATAQSAAAGVGAEGMGGGVTLLGGGAVAVEVDGPFHFRGRTQRPLGSTVAL